MRRHLWERAGIYKVLEGEGTFVNLGCLQACPLGSPDLLCVGSPFRGTLPEGVRAPGGVWRPLANLIAAHKQTKLWVTLKENYFNSNHP